MYICKCTRAVVLWLWSGVYNIILTFDIEPEFESKRSRKRPIKILRKKRNQERIGNRMQHFKGERDTRNGEIEEKNKEKMQQTGRKKKTRTDQQRKIEKMKKREKKEEYSKTVSKLLIRIL